MKSLLSTASRTRKPGTGGSVQASPGRPRSRQPSGQVSALTEF